MHVFAGHCINYVQADCSKHQLVKASKDTSPARHPSVHDGDCILLSQDLKFSRGSCFARPVMTRQLLNPDHENLGEGLRTFPGMCTYPCDSASGSASTTFGPNFAGW